MLDKCVLHVIDVETMLILFNETILVKQMDASKEYTDGFMKRIDR